MLDLVVDGGCLTWWLMVVGLGLSVAVRICDRWFVVEFPVAVCDSPSLMWSLLLHAIVEKEYHCHKDGVVLNENARS